MWGYSYNYPHTRGINRYIKFGMGPEVQRALLIQQKDEVEAFARDRGLDPALLFAIVEAAMRIGRVPDLRMFGVGEDDAWAIGDFLADTILNIKTEDKEEQSEGAKMTTRYNVQGALDVAFAMGKPLEAAIRDVKVELGLSDIVVDDKGKVVRFEQKAPEGDAEGMAEAMKVYEDAIEQAVAGYLKVFGKKPAAKMAAYLGLQPTDPRFLAALAKLAGPGAEIDMPIMPEGDDKSAYSFESIFPWASTDRGKNFLIGDQQPKAQPKKDNNAFNGPGPGVGGVGFFQI